MLNGGGTDEHCLALVQALCRLGIEAALAGPGGRNYSRKAQGAGLKLHDLSQGKGAFILGAARILRRNRIEIIHAHHGRDLWPAILARKFAGTGAKLVLTRHMAKAPSSWVSRRFLLGQCDALIAVSDFVARVLREGISDLTSSDPERRKRPPLLGDFSKIKVIRNGVDTARFRPADASALRREWGLAPEHYAFGVVGGYEPPQGKGQRIFLEAAARIRSRVPHARFLMIGRGNLRPQLVADIERLDLAGVASLPPYCQDMPAAMNALDCLVLPQTGTEAFGLVLIEAFACGKPVIASRLDGIPEAFAAAGFGQLVEPGEIQPLADAMLEQCGRRSLSAGEKAAQHASIEAGFSIGVMAGQVLELYNTLLGRQGVTAGAGRAPKVDPLPGEGQTKG